MGTLIGIGALIDKNTFEGGGGGGGGALIRKGVLTGRRALNRIITVNQTANKSSTSSTHIKVGRDSEEALHPSVTFRDPFYKVTMIETNIYGIYTIYMFACG